MTINGTSTRPPKAALLVAQRIVQDALREGRNPGDLLAPEPGVARSSAAA